MIRKKDKNPLTVIIPFYNEENTLAKCIEKVLQTLEKYLHEVILIDDGSTDSSYEIAYNIKKKYKKIKIVRHTKNSGKGYSIKTGIENSSGDIIAIQDADLEYDPSELKKLIDPIKSDIADVVIGSRFSKSDLSRVLYFWHYMGNKLLTFLSNLFTNLNLSDMESCYKVFKKDVLNQITLKEKRFGIEPELIAKIAHKNLRIYEIGISYFGRTYEEGKKITFLDGFRAVYCIVLYNFRKTKFLIQYILFNLVYILLIVIFQNMIESKIINILPSMFISVVLSILFDYSNSLRLKTFIIILTICSIQFLPVFLSIETSIFSKPFHMLFLNFIILIILRKFSKNNII